MKEKSARLNLEQLETRFVPSVVSPIRMPVPVANVAPAETLSLNFAKVIYSMDHVDAAPLIHLRRVVG